jgi:hypothetical protein
MLVVRAWPGSPPAGRPHVVDGWPRVPVDDYDYRPLLPACGTGAGVVSMDWDTAASREDLLAFARQAAADPAGILAAPVRTYHGPRPGQWNLAWADGRIVGEDERPAEVPLFGFGLVYLPRALLAAFVTQHPDWRLTDTAFSSWHYETAGRGVRVAWSVRPVHLHYPEAEGAAA